MSQIQYWHQAVVKARPPIEIARPGTGTVKRAFDLVFGFLVLPVAGLVVGVCALVLALSGTRPFYLHRRIGRDGRPFQCVKLRTMEHWSKARFDAYLARSSLAAREFALTGKLADDPRISRIGRFMRRASIDEIPQLINVLRGEMSLVGPRPITEEELEGYDESARQAYLQVAPGITGLWQVQGRSRLSMRQRADLDELYVRRLSLGQDLWILLRTVPVVLRLTGV